MDGIPRSLTPARGGENTPPFDSSLSNSNRSASVQSHSPQENTVAADQQAAGAGSSSAADSGLESALEDIQVTGQSHTASASLPSGLLGFGAGPHINGLIVLNSHDGEGTRRDYNPDEDEVDSDDGDAGSESDLGLHSGVRAGSAEASNNGEDGAEVEDITNEEENEGSESDDEREEDDGMSGANEDDDDFILPQPPIDFERIGCRSECRRDLRHVVDFYEKQVETLQDRLRSLTITNSDLRTKLGKAARQIGILKNSGATKKTKTTWHEKLRLCITNPDHRDALPYSKVYKLCCKEENMSTKPENVHPNLRLRRPMAHELQADALDGLLIANAENGPESEPEGENQVPAIEGRDGPEALFVQNDEQTGVKQLRENSVLSNLPFEKFPANIQANIFKWIYIQEDKLIHCISRLDPYLPPEEPTGSDLNRSGLPHRFHLSGKSCNVTYAIKPNDHLALLFVCKRWHYLGVHAFYGLNTFAFSSLGEFGRFCTGIGDARRERIQHVELLWMGNQHLTHRPVKEGKELKWGSKRAWDLSWLCQMPRLKSLIIHINESGSDYKRRKHEPAEHINWMASMTAGQPNFRLMRSLRNLQGLDFIHQLRGIELIQFYDYEMARKKGGRHPIRDWSFFMDIENVTAMPKTGDRAQAAEFENLTPVLGDFVSPDGYLEAVKDLYRRSEAFDAKHISPVIGEKDGDEDGNEDGDGDVKMLDIVSPVERRKATASQAAAGAEHSGSSRKTAATKNLPAASEVRYDSAEDGSGSEDNDVTPKANVPNARSGSASSGSEDNDTTPKANAPNARSGSAGSDASTVTEDGVGNSFDDRASVTGSSAENPIDLDYFEPGETPRLTDLQHEREVKRDPSVAVSIGPASSPESERSFDSGSGLFVRSPTMTQGRTQRESTAMTDTLRKRGFEELEIRNMIDLTEDQDGPSSMSAGYPISSQASSSRQTLGHPGHPVFSNVAYNLRTQLSMLNSYSARLASEEEENPFGKKRRLQ